MGGMFSFSRICRASVSGLRGGLGWLAAGVLAATMAQAQPAPSGGPRKVTFKTLATYPLETTPAGTATVVGGVGESGDNVVARGVAQPAPADFASLDGARVTITGYMLPLAFDGGRTREFMLMRSQAACCYGLTPKANEFVLVKTSATAGVALLQDVPASFTGVLRIEPVRQGGIVVQCFRLEAAEDARKR